jgi:hypothetical protein
MRKCQWLIELPVHSHRKLISEVKADNREPVHEDMNIARYLVDYLLRKGYMKSAQAVTDEASVEVRGSHLPGVAGLMNSNWWI